MPKNDDDDDYVDDYDNIVSYSSTIIINNSIHWGDVSFANFFLITHYINIWISKLFNDYLI